MNAKNTSPPKSERSNRFGGGSPEVLNHKLNYFINSKEQLLYLDGKGEKIARLDHSIEEAKNYQFCDFILDKQFNE